MIENFSLPIRYLGLSNADPDRTTGRDCTSDQCGKIAPLEYPAFVPRLCGLGFSSLRAITDKLNARKVPKAHGDQWHPSSVLNIFSQP
jgi:hypothetical protein